MEKLQAYKNRFPYIYRSIILTPILAFIALLTGGAGHGVYIIIKLFYPYSVLMMIILNDNMDEIFFSIGLLLYIFYGVILTIAERKGKLRKTAIIIVTVHLVAFILCLVQLPKPF